MRNYIFYLALSCILLLFTSFNIAQTQEEVFCDTVGNSQVKTFDISHIQDADSIKISLYCVGEIDLDTLGIKFVQKKEVRYKGAKTNVEIATTKNATYSKALSVDLNAGVSSYTAVVVTIPKSAYAGYNYIRAYLRSASSGNDATDTGQKAVVSVFKY